MMIHFAPEDKWAILAMLIVIAIMIAILSQVQPPVGG